MESVQELKGEELDKVKEKNGDKEKGADLEMGIKRYRDLISQKKSNFCPQALQFGQNHCAHRVQRPRKRRFTWLFCKNMTKNNF